MIKIECPLCHEKIDRLNVVQDGKFGWGFCPKCRGELSEEQTKQANTEYSNLQRKHPEHP
jgi:uncharacterized protein YbaR (Trm112 family)